MGRLAAILGTLLLAGPASAHPVWSTTAEVHHRPARGVLEVSLQVSIHDLEQALSARVGRRVRFDDAGGTDPLVAAWVADVFVVTAPDGAPRPARWVGQEPSIQTAWLYFEVPVPDGVAGLRVANRAFFDLSPRQVNTVSVHLPGAREPIAQVLTRETPALRLPAAGGDAAPPADDTTSPAPSRRSSR